MHRLVIIREPGCGRWCVKQTIRRIVAVPARVMPEAKGYTK